MQATVSLLQRLTTTAGISGHEKSVRRILTEELSEIADPATDLLGSVCFELPGAELGPSILFVAHMDEIGFIVADINKNGTLKLQKVGGWDPATLQSSPVEITNTRGESVFGVIGSTPVHYQTVGSQKLEIEDMFVDIGAASDEEVRTTFAIRLGSPVTPLSRFHYSETNRRVFAKALDDRIGCLAIAELGQQLHTQSLPNRVILSGSVQEEVGIRGATVLSNYAMPDLVVVLEGPPADDMIKASPQCAVGKGVHIRVFDPTVIVPPALLDFVTELAVKHNIPHQLTVRSSGGTDAARLHMAHRGVPSIVLGVPVRYAHSHHGCISLDDYQAMLDLCRELALAFDEAALQRIQA